MPFPKEIRLEALIACQRHCCLCHERKHTLLVCHHIIQEADGGPDTYENCIPLCPECHALVGAYNPRHAPGATPYSAEEQKRRRDNWYAVIRDRTQGFKAQLHRHPAGYPHSPALAGTVTFNYSHHDGFYRLGEGDSAFLTHWTKSSNWDIQCYTDGTNVAVALAPKNVTLQQITQASTLHFGSRVRRPQLQQFAVLENHAGRYAAIKILRVDDDTRGADEDLVSFAYWILSDGGDDFSVIP